MLLKQFADNTPLPGLTRAVVRQIDGWENAKMCFPDIFKHGILNGFSGFITYTDTEDFFIKNRKNILLALIQLSEDTGQEMLTMIQAFPCIGIDFSLSEISSVIYSRPYRGNNPERNNAWSMISNGLSWFAAETVADWYMDRMEAINDF